MNAARVPPSGDGVISSVLDQIRAERLRSAVMRLSFGGVLLIWLVFLAWAVPWVPIGLAAGEYDGTTIALLALAVASGLASTAFAIVWMPQFRHEHLPEFSTRIEKTLVAVIARRWSGLVTAEIEDLRGRAELAIT
jgi:NADH:ubiquinone oxidoreductase subunit K